MRRPTKSQLSQSTVSKWEVRPSLSYSRALAKAGAPLLLNKARYRLDERHCTQAQPGQNAVTKMSGFLTVYDKLVKHINVLTATGSLCFPVCNVETSL
jgi:hypothetical protein